MIPVNSPTWSLKATWMSEIETSQLFCGYSDGSIVPFEEEAEEVEVFPRWRHARADGRSACLSLNKKMDRRCYGLAWWV